MEYTTVTVGPGIRVTQEAASMVLTRYAFAADVCRGCDVLEVASGPGMGLGYLARSARTVVGSDCTQSFLWQARQYYGGGMNLVRLDAQTLPFKDNSFDAIVFFEAIYYLAKPQTFLDECRRVLRSKGILLICTVNPRWPGFNPSPFSVRYFCGQELLQMLGAARFAAQLFAAFPVPPSTPARTALLHIRKCALHHGLITRTIKRTELLKR